jgi:hypothetical protein
MGFYSDTRQTTDPQRARISIPGKEGMTMADKLIQPKIEGTLHIHVTENIQIDALTEIFRSVGTLTGHPLCGILGVDVRLSADKPA